MKIGELGIKVLRIPNSTIPNSFIPCNKVFKSQ